jgi:hypothetical protein
MPLILAIESDKRQAAQLSAVVRNRLKAELVLADSAERALHALGDRIPDLILTPALLSPRDENAITEHLRRLDAKAAHVQTLTVPLLASATQGSGRGVLSSLRREKSHPGAADGCDPAMFAEQVQAYLDRAAMELEERRRIQELREGTERDGRDGIDGEVFSHVEMPHVAAFDARHVPEPPRAEPEPNRPDVMDWQDGWKVVALEELAEELAAPSPEPVRFEARSPELAPVVEIDLAAFLDEPEKPSSSRIAAPMPIAAAPTAEKPVAAAEAAPSPEAAIMAAVAAVERLLQPNPVAQPVSAPQPVAPQPVAPARPAASSELRLPSITPEPMLVAPPPQPKRAALPEPLPTMKTTAQPPKKRMRRPKPVQDEWGLFDPTQCGIAALVARLEDEAERRA